MQHEMQYGKIHDTSVEYNKQEYGQQGQMGPVVAQSPYPQVILPQQSYIVQQPIDGQQRIYPMPYIVQPGIAPVCHLRTADGLSTPIQIQCPYCERIIITQVSTQIGPGTVFISILLLALFWPCFWLPCVMDDCKDRVHICTNCGHQVGKKKYIC